MPSGRPQPSWDFSPPAPFWRLIWRLSYRLFFRSSLLLCSCSPTLLVLDRLVSADSLFVLSFWFNSCHNCSSNDRAPPWNCIPKCPINPNDMYFFEGQTYYFCPKCLVNGSWQTSHHHTDHNAQMLRKMRLLSKNTTLMPTKLSQTKNSLVACIWPPTPLGLLLLTWQACLWSGS